MNTPASWGAVAVVAVVSIAIRLAPEWILRGREPPAWIRRGLPWLPVAVAGAFVGILHLGEVPGVRADYVIAALVGSLTLLWRRTFYFPLIAGAVTLALLRKWG